jgi:transcriptional regulator with XRE-family HTH domain
VAARVRPAEAASWKLNFGVRVRELRVERGVSQLQLSATTGLAQPFISDVEQGRKNVSLVTLYVLAIALDVDPRELLRPPAEKDSRRKPTRARTRP